jgi:hypothetical protein
MAPVLFWVIASSTDAGKTEVSAGLVRLLNKIGVPALGFKPYGGMELFHSIDLMVDHYPATDAKLFGGDAIKLVDASPLTDKEHLEVVAPSYRLVWPNYPHVILVRTGSKLLGDRQFFKTENTLDFWNRNDAIALVRKTALPLNEASIIAKAHAAQIDVMAPDKQRAAFNYLKTLGPRVIVCEGAGNRLPIWNGCPTVNHVLFLSRGVVYLFPFANLKFSQLKVFSAVPFVTYLTEALKQKKVLSAPIWLSASKNREAATEKMIFSLIKKAEILQMAARELEVEEDTQPA